MNFFYIQNNNKILQLFFTIKESTAKEEKIRAIEEQKAAIIEQRETLQADREKKLAEARAKKKLLNQQVIVRN